VELSKLSTLINKGYKTFPQKYLVAYDKNFNEYPHMRLRFEIVMDVIKKSRIKKILDVGCGSCMPLLKLLKLGYDIKGIDLAKEMIQEGKKLLESNNLSPTLIKLGDVFSISEKFDCIINLGAFPTCVNDNSELRKYKKILNKGGKIFVEHRNELFSLFTFNSYTYKLYKKLIPDMPNDVRKFLKQKFKLSEPNNSIPYYKLKPRLHNPLIVSKLYETNGFIVNKIHFYHYHWIPPILEENHKAFNKKSLKLEKPDNWKGVFMASAFVVEATTIYP